MYRCSGRDWQEWGWGTAGGDGFQYTALLRDAAASPSTTTQPAGIAYPRQQAGDVRDDDDDDDDEDVDNASPLQQGRQRKTECKPGQHY